MKRVYLLLLLLCAVVNSSAQSFDSLKKKSATAYNEELSNALESNNIDKIKEILSKNPEAVNHATYKQEAVRYRKQVTYAYKPLINDAIDRALSGKINPEICRVIIEADCDLTIPFTGKTPIYQVLSFIAVTPKDRCKTAEEILKYITSRPDFNVNQKYQDLYPPLSFLIRENYAFLKKFSPDYISDNVFKMLIDKGASINTYDKEGNSLMAFAFETKNNYLQGHFIEKGVNVNRSSGNDKKGSLYRIIEEGKLELLQKIIEQGYDLNLHTFENDPSMFKNHTDVYEYISNICATKSDTYEDIILFRKKFADRFHLVQEKYEKLALDCEKGAYKAFDIKDCEAKFSDLGHFFKAKKDIFYKKNCEHIEKISSDIKKLFESKKINDFASNLIKDEFITEFYTIYKDYYDPQNKLALLSEIENIYKVCETINKSMMSYDYYKSEENFFFGLFMNPPIFYEWKWEGDMRLIREGISMCEKGSSFGFEKIFKEAKGILYVKETKTTIEGNKAVDSYNRCVKRYNEYVRAYNYRSNSLTNKETKPSNQVNKKCAGCRIDSSRGRLPDPSVKGLESFFKSGDGKVYLENDDFYEFNFYDGKWVISDIFFLLSRTKFDKFEEMLDYILDVCREKHCE